MRTRFKKGAKIFDILITAVGGTLRDGNREEVKEQLIIK